MLIFSFKQHSCNWYDLLDQGQNCFTQIRIKQEILQGKIVLLVLRWLLVSVNFNAYFKRLLM